MIPGLIGLNWPNRLTILRILVIPVFVISLLYHNYGIAFGLFCLASLTDGLDGFIARSYNQKTKLGTFLDPLADKLLLSSSYIVLASLGHFPVWLSVLVLSRDFLIWTGLLILYLLNIPLDIAPTFLGKVTTFSQFNAIFLFLLNQVTATRMQTLTSGAIWVAAVFTIWSGLDYVYIWVNRLNNGSKL